jgi:hypothetical protein
VQQGVFSYRKLQKMDLFVKEFDLRPKAGPFKRSVCSCIGPTGIVAQLALQA